MQSFSANAAIRTCRRYVLIFSYYKKKKTPACSQSAGQYLLVFSTTTKNDPFSANLRENVGIGCAIITQGVNHPGGRDHGPPKKTSESLTRATRKKDTHTDRQAVLLYCRYICCNKCSHPPPATQILSRLR